MNYETEIASITSVPGGLSLLQWIEDAGLAVIQTLQKTNPVDLDLFTTTAVFLDDSGVDDGTGIVRYVERADNSGSYKTCREIAPSLKNRAADSNSLEYATVEYPAFYKEGGKIRVLPRVSTTTAAVENDDTHIFFSQSITTDASGNHYTDLTFGALPDTYLATKLHNDNTNDTGAWTVGDGTYDNIPDVIQAGIANSAKVAHNFSTGDQITIVQNDARNENRKLTKTFYGNPSALLGGPWNIIAVGDNTVTIPVYFNEFFMQADIIADGSFANYDAFVSAVDAVRTNFLKEDTAGGINYRWWSWFKDTSTPYSEKGNIYFWNRNYSGQGYRVRITKALAHIVSIPSFSGTEQEEPGDDEIDPSHTWTKQYFDYGRGKFRLAATNSEREFVGNFPKKYDRAVVVHAASRVCLHNIKTAIASLPSDAFSSLSADLASDFTDANTWISTEEDSEMNTARLNYISTKLSELSTETQTTSAKYSALLNKVSKEVEINTQLYITLKNEFAEILGVPQQAQTRN